MSKTGQLVDARRVNEEYRRWITVQPPRYGSVRDELADLSLHAEAYRRYESADPSQLPSTDLRRIVSDFDVSTALPLILYMELDAGLSDLEVQDALFILESFIARRLFVGEETKEYNKFFVELVGTLRDGTGTTRQRLIAKLLTGGGSTRHWPTDEEVVEKAISRGVSGEIRTPALRVILERLEIAQRGKKSEGTGIPGELQVEHVMPQSWARHWPLDEKTIPPEVATSPYLATGELALLADAIRLRNARVQTLGNLTLLNGYLNPAAGNAAFETKLLEYKNSVLRLNRYFDSLSSWDEDAIQARGKVLGEALCRIWPRPVQAPQSDG
jgi:hypothetical protein